MAFRPSRPRLWRGKPCASHAKRVVAGEEIGWKRTLFQPICRPCRARRQEAPAGRLGP